MVEATEARLGLRIPGPLRDYYLTVGRHKLNRIHNRLTEPKELEVRQGRLVFMEENQSVVYWGVRAKVKALDPIVFQTQDPDGDDWFAESSCSSFLLTMLSFHATGGLPCIGYSDKFSRNEVPRLVKSWTPVGRVREMSGFANGGKVLCVFEEGDQAFIQVGAPNRRDFRAITQELGIGIHEA